jgi:hypothetical protein
MYACLQRASVFPDTPVIHPSTREVSWTYLPDSTYIKPLRRRCGDLRNGLDKPLGAGSSAAIHLSV